MGDKIPEGRCDGDMAGATIVLSRVPRSGTPIDRWYHDLAGEMILVTSDQVADDYRRVLPDVRAFADYETAPEVVSELRDICGSRRIARLVHATEGDLLRAARIRDEFGIPGPSLRQIWPYRDKVTMKRLVAAAGLPVPDFMPAEDAAANLARWSERVVIKPRLGSASRGVAVCTVGGAELAARLAEARPGEAMVEEFVDGDMLHVDGFSEYGELLTATVSEYINGCLAFQQHSTLGSAQLDHADPRRAAARYFAQQVIAALPPMELSPYHLELFVCSDGSLVFCEIAARLGGGLIPEALTHATGQNPALLALRAQAGLSCQRPSDIPVDGPRYGFLLVPPRTGLLAEIRRPEPADWLDSFYIRTTFPRQITEATTSTDAIVAILCHGGTNAELRTRLNDCTQLVSQLTSWGEDCRNPTLLKTGANYASSHPPLNWPDEVRRTVPDLQLDSPVARRRTRHHVA